MDKLWLKPDLLFLRSSLDQGMSFAEVAGFLCRDEDAVRKKAEELGLRECAVWPVVRQKVEEAPSVIQPAQPSLRTMPHTGKSTTMVAPCTKSEPSATRRRSLGLTSLSFKVQSVFGIRPLRNIRGAAKLTNVVLPSGCEAIEVRAPRYSSRPAEVYSTEVEPQPTSV